MRLVWLTEFVSSPPQNCAKNLCLVGGVRWMDERIFLWEHFQGRKQGDSILVWFNFACY